jgi:hypothetical protein
MATALMDGELGSIVKVSAAAWAAMSYARLRPGAARLAALLPVVALLYAVPFDFSTSTFRGTSAFFLTWLGSFKLLLLAAGQGPLDSALSLPHFVYSASLPVKLRTSAKEQKIQEHGRAPVRVLLCAAVIPAIIYAYQFKSAMHRYQLLALYTLHVYFSLDLLLSAVRAVIHDLLGMEEMEPQVDRPWLASSLRDFWGRRWNLMVPSVLRPAVFLPVRAILGSAAAGVLATFLVSGLMHELVFYYIMRCSSTSQVTAFFVLHGACAATEGWYAKRAGRWWWPPRAAAVPMTLAFVAGTAFWLFFPAMVSGGLDEMCCGSARARGAGRRAACRRHGFCLVHHVTSWKWVEVLILLCYYHRNYNRIFL